KETPQAIQNPPKEPSVEYEHQAINVESEEVPF
ncbi:single-stranded DNA-binding protein, partial [Campylobacter vulpis]|nr:single-stranded DNA-binding protein [Campylobacter vulpis]